MQIKEPTFYPRFINIKIHHLYVQTCDNSHIKDKRSSLFKSALTPTNVSLTKMVV